MKAVAVGGLTSVIIAHIVWGINFPINKIALETIPPAIYAILKLMIAAGVFAYPAMRVWRRLSNEAFLRIFIGSSVFLVAEILFLYAGLARGASISGALIYAFAPLLLFILSILFLHEPFKKKIALGIPLSLIGVLIVIIEPIIAGEASLEGATLSGNLMFAGATLSSIIGILIYKPVLNDYSPIQVSFVNLAFATILMAPFALREMTDWNINEVSTFAWGATLWGGIVALGAGFFLYYKGLSKILAEEESVLRYLTTLTAVIASMIILDEQLTILTVIGGGLIIAGIVVSEIKFKIPVHINLHHRRH